MPVDLGIVITTYNRQEYALRTIRALKENLHTGSLSLLVIIADDGSGPAYCTLLEEEARSWCDNVAVQVHYRTGVGHNMNAAIQFMMTHDIEYFMMFEDDWQLRVWYDVESDVTMMKENSHVGMIRYGYISPGIQAEIVSYSNRLWWNILPNGYQYRFSGHPSLRTMEFHRVYGMYAEGLAPGMTELDMCAKVNSKAGPQLLLPTYTDGQWGIYSHIGTESLAGVAPER